MAGYVTALGGQQGTRRSTGLPAVDGEKLVDHRAVSDATVSA